MNNDAAHLVDFKGYLHYETIFCHKVALNMQLMIFLLEAS